MLSLNSYVLDREAIKLNAYRLICLFYANKEIYRLSDPTHEHPDAAALLERTFFGRELTHLLLNIAIALRTLDDQMSLRSSDDSLRIAYEQARDKVNKQHQCMMFDFMTLRETCNKIIHATTVEPHKTQGVASHLYDEMMWEAWQDEHQSDDQAGQQTPDFLPWEHLSGLVRLGGKRGRDEWWHLLEVPTFAEAAFKLLSDAALA